MTACMTLFLVESDMNDSYMIRAIGVIVDQSFLKIESYRTKRFFLILMSRWMFINSWFDMAADVEASADKDGVVPS
jgi:hypothetical protein